MPYLRQLKGLSPRTFTMFLGNPHALAHGADVIWAPAHDLLAGPHIVATPTAPHIHSIAALEAARKNPDVRVSALPAPRASLLVGGPSRHHRFGEQDIAAVIDVARKIRGQGFSLAVTASRRTPSALVARLHAQFADDPHALVWAGEGENPYPSMLALSDAIVVTADSTNMVSEAVAVGVPVHILTLAGGSTRLSRFVDGLVAGGVVRLWTGALTSWPAATCDATADIAAEVARRYATFQQGRGSRFARTRAGR